MKHALLVIVSLIIGTSSAHALSTVKLGKADPLQIVVSEVAVELRDGNISTGTTMAHAMQITSKLPGNSADWKKLAVALFAKDFEFDAETSLPASATLRISSYSMMAKSIAAAAKAIAESNDYNMKNEELMASMSDYVTKMLAPLGDSRDIHFLAVKTRLMSDVTESMRNVRTHLFVNVKDGKTLAIYTIQGTM